MMIEHPLASIDAWLRYFEASPVPILRSTHEALCALRNSGDQATAQRLAAIAKHDALCALQILRYLLKRRSAHQITDVTAIERVILMVGVDPLLTELVAAQTVEDMLDGHEVALDNVRRVLQRAHHAALSAERWASFRHDIDTAEVVTAALLRDIAEVLVGCFAPRLIARIRAMQHADRRLRSQLAQKVVLSFSFIELQLALVEQWRLPAILKMLMDESHAEHPRVRTVATAVAFARHIANGWGDAALPDDYKAVAEIVSIPPEAARILCIEVTMLAAESWHWYADSPNMPPPPPEKPASDDTPVADETASAEIALAPPPDQQTAP